jgi:hypothetical protein
VYCLPVLLAVRLNSLSLLLLLFVLLLLLDAG